MLLVFLGINLASAQVPQWTPEPTPTSGAEMIIATSPTETATPILTYIATATPWATPSETPTPVFLTPPAYPGEEATPQPTPTPKSETYICEISVVNGIIQECCGPNKPWENFHNNCNVISKNISDLCAMEGLKCKSLNASCTGPAGCEISHSINGVEIDGLWYFADGTNAKLGDSGFKSLEELLKSKEDLKDLLKKPGCDCSVVPDKSDVPSTEPEWCFGNHGMNTATCNTCCDNAHKSCVKYAPAAAAGQCDENKTTCNQECSKGNDPLGSVCTEISESYSECLGCCVSKTPYDPTWYGSCANNCYDNLKGNDIPEPVMGCSLDPAVKTNEECMTCCSKYTNPETFDKACGNVPAYACTGMHTTCQQYCNTNKKPTPTPSPMMSPTASATSTPTMSPTSTPTMIPTNTPVPVVSWVPSPSPT